MILEFSDWLLFSNVEANQAYAAEELASHCTCGYCRNFYKSVDKAYPNLRYFLSRFGLDIEAPEALIPLTSTLYQASYAAEGRILRFGSEPIFVDGVAITIEKDPEPDTFVVQVGLMELPWVLEECMDSVDPPYSIPDMFSVFRQSE